MDIYIKNQNKVIKNFIRLCVILNIIIGSHVLSGIISLYGYGLFNILKLIVLILTYMISLILLGCISFNKNKTIMSNNSSIFIFLIVFIIINFLGSTNISVSLKGILFLICDIVMCISLIKFLNDREIFNLILSAFIIVFLINIIFTFLFPEIALSTRDIRYEFSYMGSFPQKNILGTFLALFCIQIFIKFINTKKRKKPYWLMLMIIAIITLFITNSMTSLLCFLITIFIIIVSHKRRKNINTIKIGIFINIMFFLLLSNLSIVASFLKAINRDPSLSGRIDIWQTLFEVIKNRLYFGYGFENLWDNISFVNYIQNRVGFKFIGSHSGVIEILLQVGFIGLTLICIVLLLIPLFKIKKYKYKMDEMSLLMHSYYIYFLLYAITERVFISSDFQTFLLILFAIYLNSEKLSVVKKN